MPSEPRAGFARSRLILAAILLPATVGAIVLVGGGRALAGGLSCGDTITVDTTLESDLVDCPNNGVVIGAPNVTLDLNGHLIDGDVSLDAGCNAETEFCDTGVVNDGHNRVTVRGGSIRQFGGAVTLFEVRRNRLQDISTSANHFIGIQLFDARRSLVQGSSGTGSKEEIGLGLFGSHHVRILHNSFLHIGFDGIEVSGGARNRVARNEIHGAGKDGLSVYAEARHVRVSRNHASGSGDDGFDIEASSTKLTKNHARRNGDLGIDAVQGVLDGGGNLARHNGDPRQCTNVACS